MNFKKIIFFLLMLLNFSLSPMISESQESNSPKQWSEDDIKKAATIILIDLSHNRGIGIASDLGLPPGFYSKVPEF